MKKILTTLLLIALAGSAFGADITLHWRANKKELPKGPFIFEAGYTDKAGQENHDQFFGYLIYRTARMKRQGVKFGDIALVRHGNGQFVYALIDDENNAIKEDGRHGNSIGAATLFTSYFPNSAPKSEGKNVSLTIYHPVYRSSGR
jgi:hypothetical protein